MSYAASFKTLPTARYIQNEDSCVGSGGKGVVSRAFDTTNGRVVALKFQARDKRPAALQQHKREHVIHSALSDHPNIVTLIDTYITEEHVVSAMHLCRGGDLFTVVFDSDIPLRVDEFHRGFLQLTSALSYMHDNGLYHRDIKPENVLVSPDRRTWQICDFNCATEQETTKGAGIGTTFYRAPEVFCGHHSNPEADIYALGMTFFVAVARTNPWVLPRRDDPHYSQYLVCGSAYLQTASVSEAFGEFCSWFLTPEPADRISLADAMQELETLDLTMLRRIPVEEPQPIVVPSLIHTASDDTASTSSIELPATPPLSASLNHRDEKLSLSHDVSYSHAPFSIAPIEPTRQKTGVRHRLGLSLRRAVRTLCGKTTTSG